MLNVNKSLDVYPAGFHFEFIYNYDWHRNNANKIKAIDTFNQIYIFYVH